MCSVQELFTKARSLDVPHCRQLIARATAILRRTEKNKLDKPSTDMRHVFTKIQEAVLCGHNVQTEGVFVTQLSGNANCGLWQTAVS